MTSWSVCARNAFDGQVIAACLDRHWRQEWLKPLRIIDRRTPADKPGHIIPDNYALNTIAGRPQTMARPG